MIGYSISKRKGVVDKEIGFVWSKEGKGGT
jgi:hypothetical protein